MHRLISVSPSPYLLTPSSLKREVWLDWARTIAIISIVLCHCTETIYPLNLIGWQSASEISKVVRTVLFTIGRLGVPIFLFLSGYLLLSRHPCKSWHDILNFYKTKWFPLLICYEAWIVIYNIFLFCRYGAFDLEKIAFEFLFLDIPPFGHLWYMPMIIGLYIAIPFVSYLFESLGEKFLLSFFTVSFLYSLFGRYLKLDLSFIGSCYVTYFLVGSITYLYKDKLLYKGQFFSFVCFILFFILVVLKQMNSYNGGQGLNVWYSEPYLIICATFLFPSIFALDKFNLSLVKILSIASFAIYLMHNLFLNILYDSFKNIEPILPRSLLVCFLCFLCLLFSFAVFKLITSFKIAKINKLLFLTK